ncbi:hypothetical protein [Actinoplanes sp. NPDC049265]|uniref:hypothetical protein n=1 Tax=Actinoplanes sp. NPDC049265 TaxID=3363902 RepID=UPI00371242FC
MDRGTRPGRYDAVPARVTDRPRRIERRHVDRRLERRHMERRPERRHVDRRRPTSRAIEQESHW